MFREVVESFRRGQKSICKYEMKSDRRNEEVGRVYPLKKRGRVSFFPKDQKSVFETHRRRRHEEVGGSIPQEHRALQHEEIQGA